jgi:hypothetical protein
MTPEDAQFVAINKRLGIPDPDQMRVTNENGVLILRRTANATYSRRYILPTVFMVILPLGGFLLGGWVFLWPALTFILIGVFIVCVTSSNLDRLESGIPVARLAPGSADVWLSETEPCISIKAVRTVRGDQGIRWTNGQFKKEWLESLYTALYLDGFDAITGKAASVVVIGAIFKLDALAEEISTVLGVKCSAIEQKATKFWQASPFS